MKICSPFVTGMFFLVFKSSTTIIISCARGLAPRLYFKDQTPVEIENGRTNPYHEKHDH